MPTIHPEVRLAELVATLSLGTDLGLGQPMEHVIRQTLIALRMSELLGLDRVRARGRLLRRAARLGRVPHRRLRAGEVVRRRHRGQGQLPPDRSRRTARSAAATRGRQAAAGARPPRAGVPGNRYARPDAACSRTTGSPPMTWLGDSASARMCARASRSPTSAGMGRGAFGAKGEQILLTSRLVQSRRRGHGLPSRAGHRGGHRGRQGAPRHPIRPGAGRPLLPTCAGAPRRSRSRRPTGTR